MAVSVNLILVLSVATSVGSSKCSDVMKRNGTVLLEF